MNSRANIKRWVVPLLLCCFTAQGAVRTIHIDRERESPREMKLEDFLLEKRRLLGVTEGQPKGHTRMMRLYFKKFPWLKDVDGDILIYEAEWHYENDKKDKALELYKKALTNTDTLLTPCVLMKLGRSGHGERPFPKRAREFACKHPWRTADLARYWTARILVEKGETKGAIAILEEALFRKESKPEFLPEDYDFILRGEPTEENFTLAKEKGLCFEWLRVLGGDFGRVIGVSIDVDVRDLDALGYLQNSPDKQMIRLLAKLYIEAKNAAKLSRLKDLIKTDLPKLHKEISDMEGREKTRKPEK